VVSREEFMELCTVLKVQWEEEGRATYLERHWPALYRSATFQALRRAVLSNVFQWGALRCAGRTEQRWFVVPQAWKLCHRSCVVSSLSHVAADYHTAFNVTKLTVQLDWHRLVLFASVALKSAVCNDQRRRFRFCANLHQTGCWQLALAMAGNIVEPCSQPATGCDLTVLLMCVATVWQTLDQLHSGSAPDPSMTDGRIDTYWDVIQLFFTIFFVFEVGLKVIVHGWTVYWRDSINRCALRFTPPHYHGSTFKLNISACLFEQQWSASGLYHNIKSHAGVIPCRDMYPINSSSLCIGVSCAATFRGIRHVL
jgi:hypothetical protein